MANLRQAAELALKYFEDAYGLEDTEVAIKEALRQALAEPEQEPVAFYVYKPVLPHGNLGNVSDGDLPWVYDQDPSSGYSARMLVYTAPPKQLEQEPVAWMKPSGLVSPYKHGSYQIPLYAAPPKQEYQYEVVAEHANGTYTTRRIPKRDSSSWVGLTADEIWKCNKAKTGSAVEFHICSAHQNVMDFAEAIEAKLREKNT
jgi:hypothetical protein